MDISQLLTYSQGLVGDWVQKNQLANWFAPVVPVVTEKFQYRNYGSGNAFLAIDTRRSLGGSAARLTYTISDTWATLGEDSLEITIDDKERRENPETESVLEQVKTKDLTLTILNNDFKGLLAFMKANVVTTGSIGNWSNDTIDPIKELNTQQKIGIDTTGVIMNRLYFDATAWLAAKSNAKVLARLSTATLRNVTTEAFANMLDFPPDSIKIGGGALYTDAGGSQNNVFQFYSQDAPGQQDASFIKTFRRTPDLFTGMRQYREDPIRSDVMYLDWSQLRVITGAGLVCRIQVT
jgi:hypothetical protein